MNLLKIQDMLKGAPDNALVGYVQNPSGQVPTYLALSELQRRKEMRNSYQANKPEEKSVAEDLVQESQPQMAGVAGLPEAQPMMEAMQPPPEMPMEQMAQGGLAGLDTGNMYDENNYATGGIVAFDDGGEVQHYADGGTSKLGDFFRGLGNPGAINIDKQIGALQAEKNKIKMDIFSSYSQEEKAMQQQRIAEIDSQISTLTAQRSGKASNAPTSVPGSNVLGSEASAATPSQNPLSSLANPYAVPGMINPNANQPPPAAKPGLAADGTDPYALEKVKGIGDYAKDLQDYIGVDPAKAGLQERLSKMDAKAAKMEEQAPWLALARAGFEMANQRAEYGKAAETPFASAARGAGVGLKDYVESRDKLTSLEEKRFGIANDIAKSDRAEKIAIAKFGADSKQAVEEANRKAKLQQAHDKVLMQMNREDNLVRVAAANTKTAMDAKQILDAKEKIRSGNPTYLNWVNDMKKKSKNIVNTQAYKDEEEKLVNELVKREGSLTAPPTIDKSKWSLG
jgi:hypothetical protein